MNPINNMAKTTICNIHLFEF